MDKNNLKKMIKPLIKECLTEILSEQGLLRLMEENIQAKRELIETIVPDEDRDIRPAIRPAIRSAVPEKRIPRTTPPQPPRQNLAAIQEAKKAMLDKIGFSGFDPFAGSTPISSAGEVNEGSAPLVHPDLVDGGIDISQLLGANKQIWKGLTNGLNKKGEKE